MTTQILKLVTTSVNGIEDVESIKALKLVNTVLAVQMIVIGLFYLLPGALFLRPMSPPDEWWLSMSYRGIELWDLVFPICGTILLVSSVILRWISFANLLAGLTWLVLGVTWVLAGLINSPSYLFGAGLLAVFLAAAHFAIVGVWRAEGVR